MDTHLQYDIIHSVADDNTFGLSKSRSQKLQRYKMQINVQSVAAADALQYLLINKIYLRCSIDNFIKANKYTILYESLGDVFKNYQRKLHSMKLDVFVDSKVY